MSTITPIICPQCSGSITPPAPGQRVLFCPFCGTALDYDNGDRNINININKNINKTNHTIDYAKLQKLENKNKENKRTFLLIIFCFGIMIVMLGVLAAPMLYRDAKDYLSRGSKIEQGYVSPGKSAEDFHGEQVKSVIAQLESVGFTNIDKVAIGAGIALWEAGKVTDIMINGNNSFGKYACFDPNSPVVITYK